MDKKTNFIGYPIVIIITAILTFLLSTCEKKDQIDQEIINKEVLYLPDGDPKQIIDLCKGQKLYKKYKSRTDSIEKYEQQFNDAFRASRTITFKYQELVNYFSFVEQITEKTGNKISGLRFYFGKYSNEHPKYPGQQMLFFNPTIQDTIDGETMNLAYAIDESGNRPKIVIIDDINNFNCEKPGKNYSKASVFSFSNLLNTYDEPTSLYGQGGQVSPPDGEAQ
ncbi:hypothetical protein [Aquimarina sp. Aq78]|uniref:hypothetical protein n=1 Tax=Aquimarina sp. Aq78 TaxID=1191889 RepID=UPI000D0F133D|nr:hypothetical protein [Aquimarina sp. Aq78]